MAALADLSGPGSYVSDNIFCFIATVLLLRAATRRVSRTDYCRLVLDRQCCDVRCRYWNHAAGRDALGRFCSRCGDADLTRSCCAPRKSDLATVDYIDATCDSAGAPVDDGSTCDQSRGLSVVDHRYQPGHARGARLTDLHAHEAGDTVRCRSILEQLLKPVTDAPPRELADRLVSEFGSLKGVLAARPSHLARIISNQDQVFSHLRALDTAFDHCLRTRLQPLALPMAYEEIVDFLTYRIGFSSIEILYALFFNSGSKLVHDCVITHGTVDRCLVPSRAILQIALDVGASILILAHNHPGGDPEPSKGDIATTEVVVRGCRALDINLHDHLVICGKSHVSMRSRGIL
jgi:DNA repair protein RadC